VVIEITRGTQDKYEYDEKLDAIKLDRVLYGAQAFPFNYGFIPQTRADDGDHADAVVLSTNPLALGTVVTCRPIGLMEMIDSGEGDSKIISVPIEDPRWKDVKTLNDLPEHFEKEIRNFFETYKVLQNKKVEVKGFSGPEKAIEELKRSRE